MKQFIKTSVFKTLLAWRLYLFIPLFFASFVIPFRANSLFTSLWQYTENYPVVSHPLVYPWSNFDGVHYMAISSRGYIDEGRFMPLYPLLIKVISYPYQLITQIKPYGGVYFFSGLLLSHLFFFLAICCLYKLLQLDYSKLVTKKTILFLFLFPTSFFFVSLYSESLFLLLAIMSLYLARKKQWAWSFLMVSLLSITRLPGILVAIPIVYEYLLSFKFNLKKVLANKQTYLLLLIPLPLLGYAIYNQQMWGDYLYFVHAHGNLGNSREVSGLVFPLVTVYRYLKILLTVSNKQYEYWVALIEFGSLIIASLGVIFAFIKKVRPSYQLLSLSLISLPLLSGTLSGFPRYLLLSFPIFIGFALQLENRPRLFKLILLVSLLLQSLFLMLFARGWYIS